MTVPSPPPGIPSPARLENWLREALSGERGQPAEPGDIRLADVQLIAGGRSNLTYRLTGSVPAHPTPATPAPANTAPPRAPGGAGAGRNRHLELRRAPLAPLRRAA